MLLVDLRDLRRGPVDTYAVLQPNDPVLEGLGVDLVGPLSVQGHLQPTGDGDYLWRGKLSGRVQAACRRCLADIAYPVEAEVSVMFSSDPDAAEDPSVYRLSEPLTHVNVGEVVREELALAVPGFLLCRDDCAGLCVHCGADLNAGPCGCAAPAESI